MPNSGDTFDFINAPMNIPNSMSKPQQINPEKTYNEHKTVQPVFTNYESPKSKSVDDDTPIITGKGSFSFSTIDENSTSSNSHMIINTDKMTGVPAVIDSKKKKKSPVRSTGPGSIVKADGTQTLEVITDQPTINSYFETASMIKNTMDQIDMVAGEVKTELDTVRASRTMKSKYNVMVGLSSNLSDLLNAKISAIKELNNCITKSNDMDYRREKDRRDLAGVNGGTDDQVVMNMYKSILQNPAAVQQLSIIPQMADPNAQMSGPIPGNISTGIVRAGDISTNKDVTDQQYANYMANITPELSSMLYERNPDVKECVVFDASTGARWFQVMNVKTGQPIPNAPAHDQMFLEDTTLDLKNKIAKNVNLNETYPLVVINENVANNY